MGKAKYSSETVRKALEEADEAHRQIEEATRAPGRTPFTDQGGIPKLWARIMRLEDKLGDAERKIEVLEDEIARLKNEGDDYDQAGEEC